MLFASIPFLYYFLPATAVAYFLAPKALKNAVLLLASLVFYGWGEKRLVFLFAATVLAGWGLGLLIQRFRGTRWAKALLLLSVCIDLGLLAYFKYADFFLESLNRVLGLSLPLLRVALPIGISFYTFQILSYTVDVYRGEVPAQKNPIDFAAYVSFFPQLIAGPIVRYADIRDQLTGRTHSLSLAAQGIQRFTVGLGKKVLLANLFGELCARYRTAPPTVLFHWLYAAAFMLQIYFDFSGYSDMAIGLGKLFGFRLMENFDYPYISKSVTEFWRRWHISLGSWFRDYVYIPLGGNRKGAGRQLGNILVVWMLTGLWHGAAWNFVLWGLFYAVLLMLEKLWLKPRLDRHPALARIYLLTAVLLGFLLFNAPSLSAAVGDITGLFAFGRLPLTDTLSLYCLRSYGWLLAVGMIGATPFPRRLAERSRAVQALRPLLTAALLVVVTAFLVDGSFNPFLYFRF